jgi:RimJ/RimL family protein N-acetyltransferase
VKSIETERLILRNFRPGDEQALLEVAIDKEKSPYAASDHAWPQTLEEIRGVCQWFASGDEFLAVEVRGTGQAIGFVAMTGTGEQSAKNLGYCIHSAHQKSGFAHEACHALIRHAFENSEAELIVTGTGLENEPSVRLLLGLGFEMKSTGKASLRNDENGNPIEFVSASFELRRQICMKP